MQAKEKPFVLTGTEVALVMKMSLLPIMIQSQIPPEIVAEAAKKLIEKGMLQPENMPTAKDIEEYDKLAEKLGIPTSTYRMS